MVAGPLTHITHSSRTHVRNYVAQYVTHLCFGEVETHRQLFTLLPDDVVVLVERFLQL